MIARLHGRLAEVLPGQVVLDVGGVGYSVFIPLSTYYVLSAEESDRTSLFVHTHVREDALQLYGFATEEERWTFEQALAINGVGTKMALAILSGIGVTDLREAVRSEDRARLQRIPGVGRKTAERLLLELRDRLFDAAGNELGVEKSVGPSPSAPAGDTVQEDAVSALCNLGYAENAARKAVEQAREALGESETPPQLTELLRAALSGLVR